MITTYAAPVERRGRTAEMDSLGLRKSFGSKMALGYAQPPSHNV